MTPDCQTCAYRDECVGDCIGYQRDAEADGEYAAYMELQADAERDDWGD